MPKPGVYIFSEGDYTYGRGVLNQGGFLIPKKNKKNPVEFSVDSKFNRDNLIVSEVVESAPQERFKIFVL